MAQTLAKQMSQPYKRYVLALLLVSFAACSINPQTPANSDASWQVAAPQTKVETHGASEQPRQKNVLVLFSSVQYSQSFLDLIEPSIRARLPVPITFYDAYLEDPQVEEKSYRESEAETFRRRYAAVKLDLVITANPAALLFAVQYRDKIFPGVPIVFTAVGERDLDGQEWPQGVTGVATPLGFGETIDLALRLQPDTNAVAVVTGITTWDKRFLAMAHSELVRHQDRVREIDVVGPVNNQLFERVAALPPHTVVLFQAFPQFANQPEFGTWDLLSAVEQRLPTYSAFPRLCTEGCIGGVYEDDRKEKLLAGDIAARVLSGERPENIPIEHVTDLQARVDWRALHRWHIQESALPLGGIILNRPSTLWDRYRGYIIAAIVLIVVQSLLIAGLLWQRARKRKAEAVLRESEKRFRVMANTAPSLIWMCDHEGKVTYLNDRRLAFTGAHPNSGYGDAWNAYVHRDDLEKVLDRISQALRRGESYSEEYRLRRSDGVYRWMFDVAAPRVNGDGTFAGLIGSAVDITDQKRAKEALEKVSGQLIEAQEKERRRIARELHDDICQRLALLSIEIEQTTGSMEALPTATKERLAEIHQHSIEVTSDVQALSHELHSSKFDYLGMVAAIRGFCREIAEKHSVNIEFKEENVPKLLSKEISLSLFRVAQEALHNALKYSGVRHFAVEVSGTAEQVQLVVRDAGAGFDVEEVKARGGLGLVSMQERMNMVRGQFSVESRPGEGTKIVASVPLIAEGGESSVEADWKRSKSVSAGLA
jgi:PAS domain S-box-containing protein